MIMDGQRHTPCRQRTSHGLAEPPSGAGHQGHLAPELHQRAPAPAGEIGKMAPVLAGVSSASDITPSVMSRISTYWALVSPTAARLSMVRTIEGATAFTRMPRSWSSNARLWVNPATAALAALYTAIGACGWKYAMEEKLMMQPLVRVNASMAAWETSTVVLRLMAISRSRSRTVISLIGPYVVRPPATFTTISSRPKWFSAISTASAAMSGSVKSPAQGRASTPSAANSRTRSATPTALRSHATILSPAWPKARATALPI